MSIRVLLVDDHPVVRAGVRTLLDHESDVQVVGEAESGTRAIELAREVRPDIVIADLLLPDLDGAAVTERIRRELPQTNVLILTGVDDEDVPVARAIRAGALGYVRKNADVATLVRSVRSAAAGQACLSATAAAHLINDMQSDERKNSLTGRERDVLREIAGGRTNKEIARSLGIALSTVKSHVRVVLEKLGVQSRTQAALAALRSEMISPEELRAV